MSEVKYLGPLRLVSISGLKIINYVRRDHVCDNGTKSLFTLLVLAESLLIITYRHRLVSVPLHVTPTEKDNQYH